MIQVVQGRMMMGMIGDGDGQEFVKVSKNSYHKMKEKIPLTPMKLPNVCTIKRNLR